MHAQQNQLLSGMCPITQSLTNPSRSANSYSGTWCCQVIHWLPL